MNVDSLHSLRRSRRRRLGRVVSVAYAIGCGAWLLSARSATADPPKRVFWDLDYPEAKDKYGLEGSVFAVGDPVHETLTLHALVQSQVLPAGTTASSPAVSQFIRGVFWNDDPCGSLFRNKRDTSPSFGVEWFFDFRKADKEPAPKNFDSLVCKLTGRSHFGDLQFLHGMASDDGIPATDTLERMIAWAKISYAIAIGETKPAVQLSTLPMPFNGLGPANARELFQAPNDALVPQRAIGSLLHVIQDSYAAGHTKRAKLANGQFGPIEQFHSYARQDHDKHKKDDMWQGGSSDLEKIKAAGGGVEALAASQRILELYKSKTSWPQVEHYLRTGPWKLATQTKPSGP